MKRVGVLISGRGSNLQALLGAARSGQLGGEVAVVVSNVATAAGLERARDAGVPTHVVSHRGLAREDFDRALLDVLAPFRLDLVCLAGFMRILGPSFTRAYPGRVLNVHPSLLPAFPGLEPQKQALDRGVKVSGATVHVVDDGLDSGPIVVQEAVMVREDDTAETLAERILEAEHRIYPQAVRLLLEGRCRIEGQRARVEPS